MVRCTAIAFALLSACGYLALGIAAGAWAAEALPSWVTITLLASWVCSMIASGLEKIQE